MTITSFLNFHLPEPLAIREITHTGVSSSYFVGFSSLLDKLSSPSPSSVFVALFVTLLLISYTKKTTKKSDQTQGTSTRSTVY